MYYLYVESAVDRNVSRRAARVALFRLGGLAQLRLSYARYRASAAV